MRLTTPVDARAIDAVLKIMKKGFPGNGGVPGRITAMADDPWR